MATIHTTTMQRVNIDKKPCPLAVLPPMLMVCLICMAMFGNGAATGMVIIQVGHKLILKVLHRGRSACVVAVAGTPMRATAGVQHAVAFGNTLHVSSDDASALATAIQPWRTTDYEWRAVDTSLEDVFIHLMSRAEDNFSPG